MQEHCQSNKLPFTATVPADRLSLRHPPNSYNTGLVHGIGFNASDEPHPLTSAHARIYGARAGWVGYLVFPTDTDNEKQDTRTLQRNSGKGCEDADLGGFALRGNHQEPYWKHLRLRGTSSGQ